MAGQRRAATDKRWRPLSRTAPVWPDSAEWREGWTGLSTAPQYTVSEVTATVVGAEALEKSAMRHRAISGHGARPTRLRSAIMIGYRT